MTEQNVTYTIPVIDERKMYGIWLPNEGWLKGKDVFADYDVSKAMQVARLIGHGATVYFIDKSIIDFEQKYLEWERLSYWEKFIYWLKQKAGKA